MTLTTTKFWDCECDDGFTNEAYIHLWHEKSCSKCGAKRDEMPDSRVNEVLRSKQNLADIIDMLLELNNESTKYMWSGFKIFKRDVSGWRPTEETKTVIRNGGWLEHEDE
jgi:hypothetical protein